MFDLARLGQQIFRLKAQRGEIHDVRAKLAKDTDQFGPPPLLGLSLGEQRLDLENVPLGFLGHRLEKRIMVFLDGVRGA